MLENRIIHLLNKVLDPYIGGIDQNKLHLNNLLSGKVVLNGLYLKPSIVDYLGLPFHLTFGLIDHLDIKVHLPLLKLSKRKLVVEISDVVFLLTTIPESQWDPKAFREEYVAQKVAILASESLQLVVREIEGGGFMWKTLVSFLENLEVIVTNIHIRVEDYTTNPNVSYALGAHIKSAVFLTEAVNKMNKEEPEFKVDTPFRRSFYNANGVLDPNVIHRDIDLKGVGFYIDRLDPLRVAMMRSDSNHLSKSSRDPPRSAKGSGEGGGNVTTSFDHSAFVDAVSYAHGHYSHPKYGGAVSHGHFLARITRHDRMRYSHAPQRRQHRKRFRFRSRRSVDYSRHKLRCGHNWGHRNNGELFDQQGQSKVLSSNSKLYCDVISYVMDYLCSGEHAEGCENHHNDGWKQDHLRSTHRTSNSKWNQSSATGSVCNDDHAFFGFVQSMKKAYHNRTRMRRSFNTGRYMNFMKRFFNTGKSRKDVASNEEAEEMTPENIAVDENVEQTEVSNKGEYVASDQVDLFGKSVGYNLSSRSSWRILLSTFCNIEQPSDTYQLESVDMIHQAQMRWHKRNVDRTASSSEVSSNADGAGDIAHPADVDDVEIESSDNTRDTDTCPSTKESKGATKKGIFNICGDMTCDIDELEPDRFDEGEFNVDRSSPLSYDETWHVHHGRRSDMAAKEEQDTGRTKGEEHENQMVIEKTHETILEKTYMWTRYTFVVSNRDESSLKELFLRSIEETSHNYILDPKDFHGVASFYFCMYPTAPSGKAHSCWSTWGREHEVIFEKGRVDTTKNYLPRCSVFLAFQNLTASISKDQYDCLMNLIFENILKYLNWQSGIVYTFENPRVSKSDEDLYMEYWPQYLLLGQTNTDNQLREFIKDFEILHSIQVIRIMRNNSSEALRKLIRRFGDVSRCNPCDGVMNECITDVLFTNICSQFDNDTDSLTSGREDTSKLQARLRMVGGIYEIATKHAKSNTIIDSLSKICPPTAVTLDFAIDIVVLNSRAICTLDMKSEDDTVSSAKAFVLSFRGCHIYLTDAFGRDGRQFIEIELLPFSIVDFAFSVPDNATDNHIKSHCACGIIDGSATLLLSCKDKYQHTPYEEDESGNTRYVSPAFGKLRALKRDLALSFGRKHNKPLRVGDSSIYLALSFNRFCTPEEADVRVLVHVNSELFVHLRILDEVKDILSHIKLNKEAYNNENPALVGPEKRQYHMLNDIDGFYRECYELIDLGGEYSKNLTFGSIAFSNVEFKIECKQQILVCFELSSHLYQMPYFICVDSVAVVSDVTPRLIEANDESPYDTHMIQFSNLRCIRVSGDNSITSDDGERRIYLDGNSKMRLNNYLDIVAKLNIPVTVDEEAASKMLSEFHQSFELLRISDDKDVFIKVKTANSKSSNPEAPTVVVTICLDTINACIRECDIIDAITGYTEFVLVMNDFNEFSEYIRNRVISGSNELHESLRKPTTIRRSSLTQALLESVSIGSDQMLYRSSLMDFRGIVSKKWMSLQKKIRRNQKEIVNHVLYEIKLDYLYFELRRPIIFDKRTEVSNNNMEYDAEKVNATSPQSYPSFMHSNSVLSTSAMMSADMGKQNIMVQGPVLPRKLSSNLGRDVNRRWSFSSSVTYDTDDLTDRNSTMSCIQELARCCAITLPLLSVKVTGIGFRIGSTDRRLERVRCFLGSVEVEDQSNSIPLYLSTMFVGGDSIAFWRWLKVRREIHLVASCLESICGNINMSMLRTTADAPPVSGRTNQHRISTKIRKHLRHIDCSGISSDYKLTHEYDEDPFFQLKKSEDRIIKGYRRVSDYINSLMDYNVVMDPKVEFGIPHSGTTPCFLTLTLDYDEKDIGHCLCNFSSCMANVAWEVVDELLCMCMRIWDYASSIPAATPPARPTGNKSQLAKSATTGYGASRSDKWYIDTVVTVEQSSLHLMCDSAWVGYGNFVRFVWYKMLRDSFNIRMPVTFSDSRLNSIRDSGDGLNATHIPAKDSLLSGNQLCYNPSIGGRLQNLDMYIKDLKMQPYTDSNCDGNPQNHPKDSKTGGSHLKPNRNRDLESYTRWTFLKSLLYDPHRKAYLIGPIYLRMSGRGTFSLRLGSHLKDTRPKTDSGLRSGYVGEGLNSRYTLGKITRYYAHYLPCAIHVRLCGSHIYAGFTREFTGKMLGSCGFPIEASNDDLISTQGYKRSHQEFLKYARPHIRREHKYFSLMELSKETLYDYNDQVECYCLEPFRFEVNVVSKVYGFDSSSRSAQSIPQCLCIDMNFETIKASLNCVDVISFWNLVALVAGVINSQKEGNTVVGYRRDLDTMHSYISIQSQAVERAESTRDIAVADEMEVDDFHSFNSSDSDSDWISEDSDTEAEMDVDESRVIQENDAEDKQQLTARSQDRNEEQGSNVRLLDEFLSFFNFGLRVTFDLIFIELSGRGLQNRKNMFTVTLEDIRTGLWSNNTNELLGGSRVYRSGDEQALMEAYGLGDDGYMGFNDFYSISDVYTPDIDRRLSFCVSGIQNLLSSARACLQKNGVRNSQMWNALLDEAHIVRENVCHSNDWLRSFLFLESHFSIGVDVSTGSRSEMVVEPVNICLRGIKPSVYSKTFTSLNTSWINTNVSLNGVACVHGFLKNLTELSKLRTAFVETHFQEFIKFQPAILCSMDVDLWTTMIPRYLLPSAFQDHNEDSSILGLSLSNAALPISKIPEAFIFRVRNNLYRYSGYFNPHMCLAASLMGMNAMKVEASSVHANVGGIAISSTNNTVGNPDLQNDSSKEHHSYVINNLGQPIALCVYASPTYDGDDNYIWKVLEDGDRCMLPVGYYDTLLPFAIRIQLNNFIYEIPCSMLNLTQDDEFVLRLDLSKRQPRDMRITRKGFAHNFSVDRFKRVIYKFGVPIYCVNIFDRNETNQIAVKKVATIKHSKTERIKRSLLRKKIIKRKSKISLANVLERRNAKYAFVLVRTVQRLGAQQPSGGSASVHFSIYLSSTLWISNKSQENVVIFPSTGIDGEQRSVSSRSLVWILQSNPVTSAIPLANKTAENNKAFNGINAVGNNLFKQLAHMQENKQAVKRLIPAHVLTATKLKESMHVVSPQFKLQHLILRDGSYSQRGVPIPLSWTIEPSCTIGVCLQDDFPFEKTTIDATELECSDNYILNMPTNMPSHFTGDILLLYSSVQYLYESYEQAKVKTPIPNYVAQVSLGNLDEYDLMGSDVRTGFVQDITANPKNKDAHDTRTQQQQTAFLEYVRQSSKKSDSATAHKQINTPMVKRIIDPSAASALNKNNEDLRNSSAGIRGLFTQGTEATLGEGLSFESTENAPIAPTDTKLLNNTESVESQHSDFNKPLSLAFSAISKPLENLQSNSHRAIESPEYVHHIFQEQLPHAATYAYHFPSDSDESKMETTLENEHVKLLPKSILSSTLIEVSSLSRSRFGGKSTRAGVKRYEITLESCHVIENMMPYDVHIITPATYEHLNRPRAANIPGSAMNAVLHPIVVKASEKAKFSWYMRNGRFVMKELVSREFTVKVPTETIHVSQLVFENMQPSFLEGFAELIEEAGIESSTYMHGTLPRRVVLSVETSRKPEEPISDRNGVVSRFLASSQIIYTIYSEKWILSWLNYPISICRGDGRYKQTIAAQSCTLVNQDLTSTELQLAIRKSTLKQIPNFDNYPKRKRRRFFSFDTLGDTHAMSDTFTLPDLAFSTSHFRDTVECPRLHYLIASSMAPAPFFRTSVLEILPQTTLTNDFCHNLWLREAEFHKSGISGSSDATCGWYLIEPGTTLEFHAQMKGELTMEITGICPGNMDEDGQPKLLASTLNNYKLWSAGIALKPSNVTQFRYPSEIRSSKRIHGGGGVAKVSDANDRYKRKVTHNMAATSSIVKYSLCEVEIRIHRGAKMVRFMKPAMAEWVLLNTTGVDLWVEQPGVPGYGELVPAVGFETKISAEDYAGKGVPFSCYDPFKEHKLVCRFHFTPTMFGNFSGTNVKTGRGNHERSFATGDWAHPIALLGNLPIANAMKKKYNRFFRMRGSLQVKLSCVESMKCSSIFRIRYGGVVISIRLTAQTIVVLGQKTLHFTAVTMPIMGLPKMHKWKNVNFKNIYSELKNRLNVPKHLRYARGSTDMTPAARFNRRIKRFVVDKFNLQPLSIPKRSHKSKKVEQFRPSFSKSENREAPRIRDILLMRRRNRNRGEGIANWDYHFRVNILGLGTAICGGTTEEILYISGTLIKFMVTTEKGGHKFALSLGWIQFDVHDPSTCYPTMFRPMASWHSSIHSKDPKEKTGVGRREVAVNPNKMEPHVLTIRFNTLRNKYFSLREVTNCSIDLEPFSLNLDTRIGHSILMLIDEYMSIFGFSGITTDYFTTANVGIFSNVDTWLENFDVAQYPLKEVSQSQFSKSLANGTRYNISNLHVGSITLAINIRRSVSRFSSDMQAENVMIRHLMQIVKRTPHISDANIILSEESLLELCCTPYALLSHFVTRYVTQSVQQLYKVLGAVDLIGNPKIMLHHWISGCKYAASLLRDSLQYLHMPPVMLIYWFRSASRLGSAFISGIADACYRLTGSWYLLFNSLAFNSDRYAVVVTQDLFRNNMDQPTNILEGLLFGGRSLGRNLYASLCNFALKPVYQCVKAVNSMKTANRFTTDVLLTFLHIFGSIFSAVASLIFGTISSLLSGISVFSQGILNQIHSVPMLSAIRPRRAPKVLKSSGAMRYSFLESWSMNAACHVKSVQDLMMLLPMDSNMTMFDPLYAASLHWSALSEYMSQICPIAFCRPSSSLSSYFWINRTHMGFNDSNKVKWRCLNRDICSVEIFKVPETGCQKTSNVHYDDSITLDVQPKVIKKHFSNEDTYYMRIVYMGTSALQHSSIGRGKVASSLLKRLKDPSTFREERNSSDKLRNMFTKESLRDEPSGSSQSPKEFTNYLSHSVSQNEATSVHRLYRDTIDSFDLDFAGISIDTYGRQSGSAESEKEMLEKTLYADKLYDDEILDHSIDVAEAYEDIDFSQPPKRKYLHIKKYLKKVGHLPHKSRSNMAAEVIRLPNFGIAQLYFTLIVSVLKEGNL
ncbi:hypothetical protein BgAZ_306250 [Babesia gibsoni]|uniref:Chorein N-terminal domain-containing protein n=1 Tax=Babesia gibsoni TaxID=33632 RepID=A0AAD8LK82_BABGI|nr:hypothetical protein BgAZ_306250 [Babesia gibsoni]